MTLVWTGLCWCVSPLSLRFFSPSWPARTPRAVPSLHSQKPLHILKKTPPPPPGTSANQPCEHGCTQRCDKHTQHCRKIRHGWSWQELQTPPAQNAFPDCDYPSSFECSAWYVSSPAQLEIILRQRKLQYQRKNMLCKFLRVSADMPSTNATEATVSAHENKLDELYRQTAEMVSFTRRLKPVVLYVFSPP